MLTQNALRKNLLDFCKCNRDNRIPNVPKYEKRHFLTMRQIETFANQQRLKPSNAVIAYFSKIEAVERNCGCRIFEPPWHLDFCKYNRDKRIPNVPKYEKRHFLTMRQIETFANRQKLSPSRAVISYFSKIAAVERDCECRIFEPPWGEKDPSYKRISSRPEYMRVSGPELLEIEFNNDC